MSREIKFRAWDGINNKMLYHDWRDENQVHDLWQFVVTIETHCLLLQYTGLKDKNGKEIYEEDIIKLASSHVTDVFFRDSGFKMKSSIGDICTFMNAIAKHSEIIGNIYENPDLLK